MNASTPAGAPRGFARPGRRRRPPARCRGRAASRGCARLPARSRSRRRARRAARRRADAARRGRHDDRLARLRRDRVDGGVGRHAQRRTASRRPPTDTPSGLAVELLGGTATNSAWLARSSVQPITSSPTANASTPSPERLDDAGEVVPSPGGEGGRPALVQQPSRIAISPGLIDAALTPTSTSPASATGGRPRGPRGPRARRTDRTVRRACSGSAPPSPTGHG